MVRTYDAVRTAAIMGAVIESTETREWEAPPSASPAGWSQLMERLGFAVLVVTLIAVMVVIDTGHEDVFARIKLRVAFLGAGALAVILVLAGGGLLRRRHLADWLVLGYVAWSGLAWVVAPDLGDQWWGERFQFQGMGSVVTYALLYLAARRCVATSGQLVSLLWWVLAGGTFLATYGVLQRADLDPVWDTLLDGRVFSTIGNPNTLASVLVLMLPLSYYFVRRGSVPQRAVAAVAAVSIAVALVFTASRGGFIAAAVGVIIFVTLGPRPSRREVETAAAGVLVLVALVIAVSPLRTEVTSAWDRALSTFDSSDESRRFHVDGWNVTLAMVVDHPLVGVGHERFPVEFPAYRDRELSDEAIARFAPYRLESPHNVPLAIAVGAGLPALALYLSLVAVTFAAWIRHPLERTLQAAIVAVVASHLVADMFVTADLSSASVFWVLLGAMVSVVQTGSSVQADSDH